MSTYAISARRLLGCFALVLLFLSGCDTVEPGGEQIILPDPRTVTFTFEVDSDGAGAGQTVTLNAAQSATLEGNLAGFSRDEIVEATVVSAQLERLSPLRDLSALLQGAEVRLEASGLSPLVVGTLTAVPGGRTAQFTFDSSRNVAQYVARPSFNAVLELTTQAWEEDIYRFEVELGFRIVLEGI